MEAALENNQQLEVIEQKTTDVVSVAEKMVISTQDQYDAVAEFMRNIKAIKKEIDASFDESIKKAYEAHKSIVAAKKKHYEPLDKAERIAKEKSLVWYREQKRKEEEAQRKADEAARKAEEKRKAELEKQAENHEKNGRIEKAEERREQAENVFVPRETVQPTFQKSGGQAIKVVWKAEVTNLFALCNAIARAELPETVVSPVMKELNALARTWQDKKKFDGVKFYPEESLSVGN